MRQYHLPLHLLLLLLSLIAAASAADVTTGEDDVKCLKGVYDSLGDPAHRLSSWDFSNTTVGFVCSFAGVSCWNMQENRVIALNLPSMSLTGSIPSALQYCRSVTSLDLSSNNLSGSIPPALCDWLPFLVSLDLSSNNLNGSIPSELSSCKYLNTLRLASNSLSGQIPASLSRLDRLKTLDFSNNQLTGSIPAQFSSFDAAGFENNPSLCGRPLSSCGARSRRSLAIIIAAGVFGATISLLFAFFVYRWFFSPSAKGKMGKTGSEDGRWWAERLGATHNRFVQVSLFQKPIVKVKLADLMAATGNFHPDNIVTAGSARTGTSYRAILRDGSGLTVKRLHSCPLSEKAFRSEMGQVGQLRHPNLVPLLGFCVVEDERLLVYKHMPSGALSSVLHSPKLRSDLLDWPTRLRIAIGAAHGLAWLHHGFQIPVIHQNFSSSAVLLDDDYEARITDVGVTRLVRGTPGEGGDTSPFLNGDFGDFGYIAPEYASNPVATTKGDVYAFGVVLLELATGQEAAMVSSEVAGEGFKGNLTDWVSQLAGAGRVGEVIDRSIYGIGFDDEIVEFIKVAIGCVSPRPKERFSMYRAYHSLKIIGRNNDASEQYDEFPLTYCKDEPDAM
ncbi:Leucine-rich repeat receptor-like protein kinase [Rhynchospora pubera]|uniref:Leucine-rich repeat receptor-like protein kinase n=1 Tax=Rhynchospora pubera TaxID=906938 RepID=A0AAV8FHN9_9POAL|nr:Leucine-rich repeat receptor-like protein kinase [Rhynchospora pubera]